VVVLAAAQKQAELNAALARAFAALADPTRCAVVELLRQRRRRASELAAAGFENRSHSGLATLAPAC